MKKLLTCLTLAAPACTAEYDVDVYAVLPDVEAACQMLGAASATLAVETLDGEAFSVDAGPCLPQLAGQPANGFHAVIERLIAGYHRVEVVVQDADGARLGRREMPFPAEVPALVMFARPDLPGWPRVAIDVAVPACVGGGELAAVRITAAPPDSAALEVDDVVPCGGGTGTTHRITVSRGATVLAAEGRLADGTTCWTGGTEATAFDGVTIELPLARSCP